MVVLPLLLVLEALVGGQENSAAPPTPRVLILGDSISIGYTKYVQELLKDEAIVVRPMLNEKAAENCAGTTKGVEHVDRWLALDGGEWDVIHFNFGLHDLKRQDPETNKNSNDPTHPRQAEPDVYEKQLRQIVGKLEETGATLILATTTPVPAGGVRPHRDVEDPARYNDIARKVLDEHDVQVNDLYAFILPRCEKLQNPVDVHFNAEGSKALAGKVAEAIRAALARRATDDPAPQPAQR